VFNLTDAHACADPVGGIGRDRVHLTAPAEYQCPFCLAYDAKTEQ
jgi:hypothetical protein